MVVKNFNRRLWANVRESAKDAVADSTNLVYDEILHLVQDTSKNGRLYPFRGGVHQASAPGEPFANMTGNALLNTKTYEEEDGLLGRVTGESEYAGFLELGTSKMEPRPVFRPAINNKQKEIVKVFISEITKAVKKS